MKVESLDIPDVKIVRPRKFGDDRGFFSETYNKKELAEHGIEIDFIQDNQSLSSARGTLRGLHFQVPPHDQDKLVRVVRGSIQDVAVDLRHGSPTYGRYVSATISVEEWNQILVPSGFAHGILTLEPNTEVFYKVSSHYAPEHDMGVRWDDPEIGVEWQMRANEIVLSDKDAGQPRLSELPNYFAY